ncbi:MAG: HIT family protein [Candidatus Liberibacter europaeus]|uniref:HIT family protein n=1 Tax=Candidatus Liberibacter europaeus TaxID=744859 RepID=A0A2T4VZA7_9HYPH|nr:HIT family protein [Candidatus Liberibacter europaeus]PTL87098.1 MAG: HIT family protein [Candidatus Liberibacter europaeus]
MKIIRKEASAVYVYEDDLTIAIMDIMPDNPGHVLIIPRYPAKDIFDVPQESLNQIMFVSKKIAIACKKAFQADGIKIMQLNGFAAGQMVPHLHFHIIPYKNENNTIHKNMHSEKKIEKLETLESNAQKIRKELSAII